MPRLSCALVTLLLWRICECWFGALRFVDIAHAWMLVWRICWAAEDADRCLGRVPPQIVSRLGAVQVCMLAVLCSAARRIGNGYVPQKWDHTASALTGPMPLTASSSKRLENG